jgi:amino acid transporter
MSTTTRITTQITPQTTNRIISIAPAPGAARQPVWKHGVAAAIAASATTTVLATVASAAGVSFADQSGASIPIAAFAQLTLVFSLVGVGLAAVLARTVRHPRRTFLRTVLVLTALSYVPDLTFGFDARSAATLITLHTIAAGIVVPALAKQLARTR